MCKESAKERVFSGEAVRIAELKRLPAARRAGEYYCLTGNINMPLILAPIGQEMKIVRIILDEKTKKHLANLGIIVDSAITVLSTGGGSAVCVVKSGRLALDKNVAAHIYVA